MTNHKTTKKLISQMNTGALLKETKIWFVMFYKLGCRSNKNRFYLKSLIRELKGRGYQIHKNLVITINKIK
jgi:bifunctional N-acetylglucosamine-1-phosphate-uridyltransferase/glucosamine-1-phosphate-acetyltransferase GlmU-like protein